VEGFSRDNTSATQRLRMNSGPGSLSPSEGLVPSSWLYEEQCTCIQSPCGFRSTDPHFAECRNIAKKKKEVRHHSSQCIMNLEYTCHESKQACSSIPPLPNAHPSTNTVPRAHPRSSSSKHALLQPGNPPSAHAFCALSMPSTLLQSR